MEHSKNDLQGILAGFVHAHRHSSSVVSYRAGSVLVDLDDDLVTETVDRFIDCVVNDLPHQMVQTSCVNGTDIHSRSLPDGFKTFQNLNTAVVVLVGHNL